MTSGVYKLTFRNGATYIGKSNNMERRWVEHGTKMEKGTAAKNMQQAFRQCGHASTSVLLECHADHIDIMEAYFIWKLSPSLNSAGACFLTIQDANTLEANMHVLKFSTAGHIRIIAAEQAEQLNKQVEIDRLNTDLEELDEVLEKYKRIRSKEELETELGKNLARTTTILNNHILQINTLNNELDLKHAEIDRLRNRSIWDRIFNN
jgi:hypothetical protein